MSPPAFDRLLKALVEAEIGFVLVGGLAVNAWGVVRGTKDVDIVADPDPSNLTKLAEAAVRIGGHVQQGDAFVSSAPAITSALAAETQVVVETDLGRLDVVRDFPGMPPYAELRSRAVETEILGLMINVCSLEDLRAMKQGAGGNQDLADLEDLDAAEGEG
ncbi:MAG: hypothetical protein ACR2G3_07620 [Solirubrobacterales bacterium]